MRIKAVGMLVCLLATAMAFSADEKAQEPSDTSKSLFFATYKETTDRVELVAGSLIAGVAEHEKYIPLQFAVGVNGKGPELEITPARFQLIDSRGNIYNAVSEQDVAKEAGVLQYARAFNEQNPLQTAFEFSTNIQRVMSDFYPMDGGKFYVVSHLGRDSYLTDLLFFPNPGEGLADTLTLQLLTPGMDAAVELRFAVPLKHKKTEKHQKNLDKQKAKVDSQETTSGS
jgi:hypothetical protein